MTSSPSRDADRAQRQMQPGGAARDGARVRRTRRAARSAARTRPAAARARAARSAAPRARARSSASPSTGRASGISRVAHAGGPAQHAALERVDERLPGGRDDVLGDADRAPHLGAVGGVEQHARDRARALVLVEDADLEVDELDVGEVRVDLADRGAQRAVERVDRPVALGGLHAALAVDPDLDRRLGLDLAVGALLDDHAPGLEREQRLVAAGLAPQQQLERAVGGLELVAARARAP